MKRDMLYLMPLTAVCVVALLTHATGVAGWLAAGLLGVCLGRMHRS